MPKNMGKGGKSFRAGNTKNNMQKQKRDIIYADPAQLEEYAQVRKPLGNLRLELQLAGGKTVIGVIRGAMVRKQFILPGDVVLIAKREFNTNDVVDIIHRYNHVEVRDMVKQNAIPRDFRSTEERNNADNEDYVFVNDEDEDDAGSDEEDEKKMDRAEVVMDDPLAALDEL